MNRSLALLVLIPLAGACSSGGDSASDTTAASTAAPTPTSAAVAASDSASVSIADFMFDAVEVHVTVGGSVTWTNDDDQAHTATSSGNFDAGAIDPAGSSTVEFPTAGTFAYICSFHPFMNGTVVVE